MPSEDVAPSPTASTTSTTSTTSAAPSKRPGLVSRHSSSSHVSQSPAGPTVPRPGPARPHKHIVGHARMGRNPSFHRTLSKIKIAPANAIIDDDAPPTPKSRHHRRTHSSGTVTPQLPGSLASQAPPSPGPRPSAAAMKRTNTSLTLPRTGSQTALKKNHSSSQLSRVGGRNLTHMGHAHKTSRQERPELRRAYTQPLKRHKSPAPDHRRRPSVHFNVGSDNDDDGDDATQEMEGVDDVWTEDSASASPNTTRDNTRNNTRNNTRQNSIVLDPANKSYAQSTQEKPPDNEVAIETSPPPTPGPHTRDFALQSVAQTASHHQAQLHHQREQAQQQDDEDEEDEDDDDVHDDDEEEEDEGLDEKHQQLQQLQRQRENQLRQKLQEQQELQMREEQQEADLEAKKEEAQHQPQQKSRESNPSSSPPASLRGRPLDTELISKRLLEKNAPAPPRVSSISALANVISGDPKSLSQSQSQNGNMAPTGANNTPIISRFMDPEDGTGSKEATPQAQSGFLRSHSRSQSRTHSRNSSVGRHTQSQSNLQRNKSTPNFSSQDRDGLRSPTGAQTPDALRNNSRTQQKLWLQRGLSNIEATNQPHLPALLPTGRAQAMRTPQKGMQFDFVDKEYAVVRRFHNTLLQGVERVKVLNGGTLPGKPKRPLHSSASTATMNGKRPDTARSMRSVKSTTSMGERSQQSSASQRTKISFQTGTSPETERQNSVGGDGEQDEQHSDQAVERRITPAEIARRIWETDVSILAEA